MKNVDVLDLTDVIKDSRFVIVGDIHGTFEEFIQLLALLKFNIETDYLLCVGDLVDRGLFSHFVANWFRGNPKAYSTCGNHDNRFLRYLLGNPVKISHGLSKTIEQFDFTSHEDSGEYKEEVLKYFEQLPYIIKVKDNFIVHAGFNPERDAYHQTKQDCLFMRYYGGKDYFDNKDGKYWFEFYPENSPNVFFGHEVFLDKVKVRSNVYAMDGGCVFGGELRAYDSRDGQIHSVKAKEVYSGKLIADKGELLKGSEKSYKESEKFT